MRGWGRPGARAIAIAAITVAAVAGPAGLLAYAGVFASAESPGQAQPTTVTMPPAVDPQASALNGIPLGPPKLPKSLYGEVFTGTKLALTPENAVDELNAARSQSMRVFVILVGAQRHYKNEDGTFDLESWKSAVDEFRDVDLGEFAADGTIVAHQLVSEAKARAQWGGAVIPNNVLDEMARYSKERWPTMPTVLRTDPSDLEEHAAAFGTPWPGWRWSYLDAASARYLTRKGSVEAFAAEEEASARRQRLAIVAGLNVLSGGDGSSEIGSPRSGRSAMSPDELRRYGQALLLGTSACAFELWRYETPGSAFENVVYFRRPEISEALRELAAIASQRPSRACRRY
ncbi:MAG: hypothetical protein ACRDOF_05655 [Gaiellaceae bacterium]